MDMNLYEFTIAGYAFDDNGYADPITETGRLALDGAGNVSGSDTVSINGDIIRRTFLGNYTVNPDGTGTLLLNPSWGPPIHADLVVRGAGAEVDFILTD